mmetsp:Transcript_1148/g.4691  ORF Transcript_1148/g.4691 Transcript_1148/m.4691 type:complete len:357 (-) Transcript_1148:126-1196(-)
MPSLLSNLSRRIRGLGSNESARAASARGGARSQPPPAVLEEARAAGPFSSPPPSNSHLFWLDQVHLATYNFLQGEEHAAALQSFVDDKCYLFHPGTEHADPVECSQVHAEYKQLIEKQLVGLMENLSIPYETLCPALAAAVTQQGRSAALDAIVACDDYLAFRQIMTARNLEIHTALRGGRQPGRSAHLLGWINLAAQGPSPAAPPPARFGPLPWGMPPGRDREAAGRRRGRNMTAKGPRYRRRVLGSGLSPPPPQCSRPAAFWRRVSWCYGCATAAHVTLASASRLWMNSRARWTSRWLPRTGPAALSFQWHRPCPWRAAPYRPSLEGASRLSGASSWGRTWRCRSSSASLSGGC